MRQATYHRSSKREAAWPIRKETTPDRRRGEAPTSGQRRPERPPRLDADARRQVLLDLKARLRGNVTQAAAGTLAGSLETSSASPDAADRAQETTEQDLAVCLIGNVADTLDRIEAALERLEEGTYGECEDCRQAIPGARLEALPYATCCVQCAARRERLA